MLSVVVKQFAFTHTFQQSKVTVGAAVSSGYHYGDGIVYGSILSCVLNCAGCERVN